MCLLISFLVHHLCDSGKSRFASVRNGLVLATSKERQDEMLQVLDSVIGQQGCPKYFYLMKEEQCVIGNWSFSDFALS
jgi:hypothetical protein